MIGIDVEVGFFTERYKRDHRCDALLEQIKDDFAIACIEDVAVFLGCLDPMACAEVITRQQSSAVGLSATRILVNAAPPSGLNHHSKRKHGGQWTAGSKSASGRLTYG